MSASRVISRRCVFKIVATHFQKQGVHLAAGTLALYSKCWNEGEYLIVRSDVLRPHGSLPLSKYVALPPRSNASSSSSASFQIELKSPNRAKNVSLSLMYQTHNLVVFC